MTRLFCRSLLTSVYDDEQFHLKFTITVVIVDILKPIWLADSFMMGILSEPLVVVCICEIIVLMISLGSLGV